MIAPRPLATLLVSVALHGAGSLVVLRLASVDTTPRALVIDLGDEAATGHGTRTAREAGDEPRRRGTFVRNPVVGPTAPVRATAASAPPRPQSRERSEEHRAPSAPPVGPGEPRESLASAPRPAVPATAEGEIPIVSIQAGTDGTGQGHVGRGGGEPAGSSQSTGGQPLASRGESGPGSRGDAVLALAVGGSGAGSRDGVEYGAYLAALRRRIQESLRYPAAARRRGLAGTVHLEIVIRSDGAIDQVAVADSSAHPILDTAAVETVRSLAAHPFPAGLTPRTLKVRLPVVFDLQ